MPQSDLFADLYPAPAVATPVPWTQALADQIVRDTQAVADPLNSDSDRAFFHERIAMYKAEYFRLTGTSPCAP